MIEYFEIYDSEGMRWHYDGERIYMLEAEIEMVLNGEDTAQNEYVAHTPEQAIERLIEGGYIVGIYRGEL